MTNLVDIIGVWLKESGFTADWHLTKDTSTVYWIHHNRLDTTEQVVVPHFGIGEDKIIVCCDSTDRSIFYPVNPDFFTQLSKAMIRASEGYKIKVKGVNNAVHK